MEEFRKQPLQRIERQIYEEDMLDAYLTQHNIEIVDHKESREKSEDSHKVLENLGFGNLALFRSQRMLVFMFLGLGLMMLIPGLYDAKVDTIKDLGFSFLSTHSIANLEYSSYNCI